MDGSGFCKCGEGEEKEEEEFLRPTDRPTDRQASRLPDRSAAGS